MTADEINAAKDAVWTAFPLIRDLIGGNFEVIMDMVAMVAVLGVLLLLIKGLYSAVGIRSMP